MDDYMVDQWNDIIGPNDDVYHLGDFGDYSFRPKLNGNIHLILGNYDKDFMAAHRTDKEILKMMKRYFIDIRSNTTLRIDDLNTDTENIIKDKVNIYIWFINLSIV